MNDFNDALEKATNPEPMTLGKSVQNWTKTGQNIKSLCNENIAMDSFCIQIDIKKCSFVSQDITREIAYIKVDSETGEELECSYNTAKTGQNSVKIERKGYNIYFQFVEAARLSGATKKLVKKQYVKIAINSKFLEKKYLTGINSETIDIIYNRIIETGMIKLSKVDFMDSICSDIDFKQDRYLEIEKADVKRLFSEAYKSVKVEFSENKSCTLKNSNLIIDTSKRADLKKPYHKFYNKLTELAFHSYEFNDEHLNLFDSGKEQIIRCELTISGQNTARSLGLISKKESLSLRKLIFVTESQSEIKRIFEDVKQARYNPINMTENQTLPNLKVCKLSAKDADNIYTLVFEAIFSEGCSELFAYRIAEQLGKGSERKQSEAKDVAKRAINDARNALQVKENSIKEVIKEDDKRDLFSIFTNAI